MAIFRKVNSLFIVTTILGLLFSTEVFATAKFYLFPNDARQKIDCDFLEIKNGEALCSSGNLLITYDLAKVIKIEVQSEGVSKVFQPITQKTWNEINELNSTTQQNREIAEHKNIKQKTFEFFGEFIQSLKDKFKNLNDKHISSTILSILGIVILLIGSLGFLVATFRAGILWGLSCMFLPFVSFIFLIVHWNTAAKPFLLSLLGAAILFLGTMPESAGNIFQSIVSFTSTNFNDGKNRYSGKFECNGKIYCSEMSSCAEAKFYLHNCPGIKMDGDGDGIPCEKQWCGN